jgi:amino acid adenylation domain-containing protein
MYMAQRKTGNNGAFAGTAAQATTLVSGFDSQVSSAADAVALISGDGQFTYRAVNLRANRLAHYLMRPDVGVGPGVVAAVCLNRSLDLIVALLAILKAGGSYTLLDPGFPDSRLWTMIDTIGVRSVIMDNGTAGRLAGGTIPVRLDSDRQAIARQRADCPSVVIRPDDAACVMFTSGTTGIPKGLVTTHQAMYGTFAGQSYLDFGPDQVYLQCSPVSWDAFALEVFGALMHGGTSVLHQGDRADPAIIAELVSRHKVTTLQLSAGLFNVMVDEYTEAFSGLREVMTAGEAASRPHCLKLLRRFPQLRLINGYGPAESMGFTTTYHITMGGSDPLVPIGWPIAGKTVYVLDERLQLVPDGVEGEIYAAGVGLALGYASRLGVTAERFVANPYGSPGSRMYRTGDLGRRNPEGDLVFLGRADRQVKLNGIRVEPDEVEASLVALPGVSRAAVIVREDHPGDKRLVGYLVAEAGTVLDTTSLRRQMAAVVPQHIVPSALVQLDAFPLTANGKLDRNTLPPPATVKSERRGARTKNEAILRDLFAEVLNTPATQVGIDDDFFFDLGGDSLLAIKLVTMARKSLEAELTLRDVFARPTVEELAGRISARSRGSRAS